MIDKEKIYDEQISPLMTEIIDICKKNKVAMLASFAIPKDGDESLKCTTCLLEDDFLEGFEAAQDFLAANSIIQNGFVAFTRKVAP